MNLQTIKDIHGNAEYVLLPVQVYDALHDQIEDELSGLEAWADQEEDYVDFNPADYVENPVALARLQAQVKQIDLARYMEVTQSYISKLEHADHVSSEALQKVKAALQNMRK
ncbi:MAG: helix-turn-helix domain-containing protein [Thermodesulfobacteriota bacterium]|nr:helix-turn-helix domain-containing protein [Thermodesulfobacteriota bacterium]